MVGTCCTITPTAQKWRIKSGEARALSLPPCEPPMDFLLGGWLKVDDDNINDLPHDLQDIYVHPWKVIPEDECIA